MPIQTLEIHFRGVCTHFHHNFVPGVPHRVVLPMASTVRPGLLTGPFLRKMDPSRDPTDPNSWIPYYLMPHVPALSIANLPKDFPGPFTPANAPGLFGDNGYLITASRLQIVNAIDDALSYPDGLFTLIVPQLTTYFSDYAPSDDVVTGGRASAYFDIYGGRITAFKEGGSIRVKVVVTTDGPPELLVTPLGMTDQTVPPKKIKLEVLASQMLIVGNVGIPCLEGISEFDFLLHYLTSRTGIPRELTELLPGMTLAELLAEAPLLEKAQEMFKKMVDMKFPRQILQADFDLDASCSDSRYP
jgi:hypothetical protein